MTEQASPFPASSSEERADTERPSRGFKVRLDNFEGPFDLLLQLISQHRLDVTEVALHQVTDDFIAYTRELGQEWDLDEATEFLVIAATLLDLKAARLLPAAEVENEEDLALLEARDLLFARILQYRAYKQVAALFAELEAGALRRYPRSVALEERYVGLLPEVMLGVTPEKFAEVAASVFRPKPPPTVSLDHLHTPRSSRVFLPCWSSTVSRRSSSTRRRRWPSCTCSGPADPSSRPPTLPNVTAPQVRKTRSTGEQRSRQPR